MIHIRTGIFVVLLAIVSACNEEGNSKWQGSPKLLQMKIYTDL